MKGTKRSLDFVRGADTINQKILYSIWDSSGCLIHVEDEILKRQLNRRSLFYLRKKIFIGLILYAIIIELPGVKNCINEIYVEDTEICIFDSVRMDENITLNKGDFNNLLQLFMNMKRDEDIFIMEHKLEFVVKI